MTERQKPTGRDDFARSLFNRELPNSGVLSPAKFAHDHLVMLNRASRMKSEFGRDAETLSRRYLTSLIDKMTDQARKIQEQHPATCWEHVKYFEKAKGHVLDALEKGNPAEAAFFAVLMAAHSFASGEQLYVWAQQDLETRFDYPARLSRKRRKTTKEGQYRENDIGLLLCCAFIRSETRWGRKPLQKRFTTWLEEVSGENVEIPGAGRWALLETSIIRQANGNNVPRIHYQKNARSSEKSMAWSTLLKRWGQAIELTKP